MILEELHLHNFCLFRGSHVFDLRPSSRNGVTCPIVLFGGMNGAGKTTILDAVQLALYGSRAKSASRVGKVYDDYLRECVHRGVTPHEGASVSVTFRYIADGQEHRYEVWRGWSAHGKTVRERVKVAKDDIIDQVLSDNWSDFVEELIPIGISQLFFFDAEKIRFLADEDTDTAALGGAIKSLLGLDLAERLVADASVLERRLLEKILDVSADDRLQQLQDALEAKSKEVKEAMSERAALENNRLRAKLELETAQAEFASVGGAHWSRRGEVQSQLESAEVQAKELDDELRTICSGDLPLVLVPDLLRAAFERDAREQRILQAAAFCDLLLSRDKEILEQLKDDGQPAALIKSLRTLLARDRKKRSTGGEETPLLHLSALSRDALRRLLHEGISALRSATAKALEKWGKIHTTREDCLRLLNSTPEDTTVAGHVERLRRAAAEFGQLEGDARRLDDRVAALRRERDEIDKTLTNIRWQIVDREVANEESLRMAKLAQRTQVTMREFLRRATEHKIDRLSDLITRAFRFLLRKETLVERVQIHPGTFHIDLIDATGASIPKSRLSEGEKQVFAIAVLWGLAQASSRQLPAIIDTPMARLDSAHRRFLVERYFPNASHQVVILSTDTEVERGYFETLQPRISRSFHLRYSDKDRCTAVEKGYFWQQAGLSGDVSL